ncbi:MAG: aminoglycoside phosphotransferase family protein [Lachnospiraceae bacterium]|nr:aminoglycoside phosphotransferase family protein [Lachnospiraceae bacterium]
MNLKDKKVLATRPYKVVYQDGDRIVKVFTVEHGKANVFNEALCTARVEESGLSIPPVLEVTRIDGEWALAIQYVAGETLEQKMENDPLNIETYMEQFVDAQLSMHAKKAPRLTLQKDKFARKIDSLKDKIDATTRYELNTRLNAMPNHTKLCHGDFNPSNVIVKEDGTMAIVDWAHATQGNASGDAAITYLEFALKNQKKADLYLDLFCKKSDTAKQYVQKWLPIAAAAQMTKGIPEEEAFLRRWTEIIDFQ